MCAQCSTQMQLGQELLRLPLEAAGSRLGSKPYAAQCVVWQRSHHFSGSNPLLPTADRCMRLVLVATLLTDTCGVKVVVGTEECLSFSYRHPNEKTKVIDLDTASLQQARCPATNNPASKYIALTGRQAISISSTYNPIPQFNYIFRAPTFLDKTGLVPLDMGAEHQHAHANKTQVAS